jgi:hypothetical protein
MSFKEARKEIRRHLAKKNRGCGCEDYIQKFLRRDPVTNQITVKGDAVHRWTLNGPTTSLHKHPRRGFFVGILQGALAAAESPDAVVEQILRFEYDTLERNRAAGAKHARQNGRHLARGRGRQSKIPHGGVSARYLRSQLAIDDDY